MVHIHTSLTRRTKEARNNHFSMNETFSVFTLIRFPMSKTWKSASCWSLALALKWLLCESSFQIATPASTGNTSRFQDDLGTTHTRTASSQEPRKPYENETNFKTQQQTDGAGLPFPSEREAGPPSGTSTQSGRKTNPGELRTGIVFNGHTIASP